MSRSLRNKKHLIVTFCVCVAFLVVAGKYFYNKSDDIVNKQNNFQNEESYNMLDGCYHVYLDVGTNIGVQIRKLFEPEKYPRALQLHRIFNSMFGDIPKRLKSTSDGEHIVCAVGFEPNPHHTRYLKQIESSYQKCGWNVKIMTETAVSDEEGTSTFYSDESFKNMEWGGGILSPNINKVAVESKEDDTKETSIDVEGVKVIRLSDFLKYTVATRKLPNFPSLNLPPPNVVMKMDIEGSEVDVIPDLLYTGGLQYVNNLMIEWHERLEKLESRRIAQRELRLIIQTLSEHSKTMKTQNSKYNFNLINLDDESYYTSKFDLPRC